MAANGLSRLACKNGLFLNTKILNSSYSYPKLYSTSSKCILYRFSYLNGATVLAGRRFSQATSTDAGKQATATTSSITDALLNKKAADSDPPEIKGKEEADANDKKEPSKKKESRFFGKNSWKYGLGAVVVMLCLNGTLLVYEWGAPKRDEEGNLVEDEFSKYSSLKQYLLRAIDECKNYTQMIQDPTSQKLLPEPLQEPYFQPPYTLVLELNGVLIHPDWTLSTGWRFKKRPGLDYLLQTCASPLFEIVIYTSEQGFNAFPLLNSLDPQGYIMYRLFRDATRYKDGYHIKDLHCLNRDLSKVIMIDHNKKSFQLNPRNGLALKKWNGEDDDRALYDLANLLKTLATQGVEDVRQVVDYYSQYDDPLLQYRDNQAKLQEEEEKLNQIRQEDHQKRASAPFSMVSSYFKR